MVPKKSLGNIPTKFDELLGTSVFASSIVTLKRPLGWVWSGFSFFFSLFPLSSISWYHPFMFSIKIPLSNNLEFGWVLHPNWVPRWQLSGLGSFSNQWLYFIIIVRFQFYLLQPTFSTRICPTSNMPCKGVLMWECLEDMCIDVLRVKVPDEFT